MKKILISFTGLAAAAGLAFFGLDYSDVRPLLDAVFSDKAGSGVASEASGKISSESADKSRKAGDAEVNARKLELPAALKGIKERIVEHTGFTLSFNSAYNNPNWVAWELSSDETEGNGNRGDEFYPDPEIPEPHRVTSDDYRGSGYDRGHMCPAADMKWSPAAMHDCFYMSNICPQTHALNSGGWQVLERACRRWARQEGRIYIVCGPVYGRAGGAAEVRGMAEKGAPRTASSRKPKMIGSEHSVAVPDGFFKCVMSLKDGEEKAIAFYYTNRTSQQTMDSAVCSVDDIEALTGMDFFVNVDSRLEKRIEAVYSLKDWR